MSKLKINENFKVTYVSDEDDADEVCENNDVEDFNNPDIDESLFNLLTDWD